MATTSSPYDALLVVSFGGPEKPADVLPFLENVVRGRNVPPQRLLEVAEHYTHLGGASPINDQNRALVRALLAELNALGPQLAVYWGNRHWHPLLDDVVGQMADDGIQKALALVTSAFGSYSGCRQYLEHIEAAREHVGAAAPEIHKLRLFYNHPGFVEPMAERVSAAWETIPEKRRGSAKLVYTAHGIPQTMAARCAYEAQLGEACRLVSQRLGDPPWQLVFQSRSGPPHQAWLEPSIDQYLRTLSAQGDVRDIVLVPIGFLSEHAEILYDLDVEAAALCRELGLNLIRSGVIGTHPRFIAMIRELILERFDESPSRKALGSHGPSRDVCPPDCCRPS